MKAGALGVGTLGMVGSAAGDEHDDENGEDEETNDEDEMGDEVEGVVSETTDVIGQGPDGDVVAEGGATIRRTDNEILVELSMPTPEPGTYTYPSAPPEREGEWWTDEVGDLEAFTLWAFVFDCPHRCDGDCDADDMGEPAGGGAFYVSGFVSDGGDLTLNGWISTGTDPFVMDGEPIGVPMTRPMDAEVHLAVAPHGAFDPAMMPEILQTPTSPGPDIWWGAIFE